MLVWWLLGRGAGDAGWPFAAFAWLLHLIVAGEVAALVWTLRRGAPSAAVAGTLFFLAPYAREAAYWYSASTDLWLSRSDWRRSWPACTDESLPGCS